MLTWRIAMEIVHPKIEEYITQLHPIRDPLLQEMEHLAVKRRFPIVGPLVGRILFQLAQLIQASAVFEMGSGFGYSTYWFALALPQNGCVVHTDRSERNSREARRFLGAGGLAGKVRFHVGDALEALDQEKGPFDMIFVDIDKEGYPLAYQKARGKIRRGGLLVADNALWGGEVLRRGGDEATEGIKRFNELLARDADFFQTILPVRDGLSVNLRL